MERTVFIFVLIVCFSERAITHVVINHGDNDDTNSILWDSLNENHIDVNNRFENIENYNESDDHIGEPLYLTSYIESGNIEEGKRKAFVHHPDLKYLKSYSGFLTIDKNYDSNTFFWFIESETNPKDDPVMVWLIGGPGVSVFTSVFTYNGPFHVDEESNLELRKNTYTTNHSIIYIDNPLGAGYSYTMDENGLQTNATAAADGVLNALVQFFKLFPEYKENKFFVGGDSYGGKFVVTVSEAIRVHNTKETDKINLQGLVIGNGIISPHEQAPKADFLYNLGLFSEKEREIFRPYEENPGGKTQIINELFMDFTGMENNENILFAKRPNQFGYHGWCQMFSVRKAMHVGNANYNIVNLDLKDITTDLGKSVTSILEKLMENYKVLLYHGQLDAHVPYTVSMDVYNNFSWSGAEEFKTAKREKVYLDGELAGYRKIVKNLHEVMIRNAGHVASYEQREWCSNILTQFTHS